MRIHARATLLAVLILGGVALSASMLPTSPETYVSRVLASSDDPARALMRDIGPLADERGTRFAVDVVAAAVRAGAVTDDGCHLLLHLVRHQAYVQYGADLDAILAANSGKLCLGGYLHGVEAEIVASGLNVKEDLWNLCRAMKDAGVANGPCFHGVGHSAFERTKDVAQALAECDSLAGGPEEELWNCHNGVFSELGNALLGVDTNTALPIEPLKPLYVSIEAPYRFCETLASAYRAPCYTQLSKIFFDSSSLSRSLMRCREATDKQEGQNACVATVAGVWARVTLNASAVPPELGAIEALPSAELQEWALRGVKEGYRAHEQSGRTLSPEAACDELSSASTRNLCERVMRI